MTDPDTTHDACTCHPEDIIARSAWVQSHPGLAPAEAPVIWRMLFRSFATSVVQELHRHGFDIVKREQA